MNYEEVTYGQHQVVCEQPRLIINPLLPELIAKYHHYYIRGRHYVDNRVHQHYFSFNYSSFSVKRNHITVNDIQNSFVVDTTSGETFPIYIQVPCNHCDVCKERKINSFVQRCKLETQSYDSKPWFLTLTYDNEHCPDIGVSVDHAQRFLKRLRINLFRSGYCNKIRYVLVGEYGKNTHRPHYHAIIWNLQAYSTKQYKELVDLIDRSWGNGFIQSRIINPENDKCFYYTAKYLRKDCVVPKGMNDTFVLSSRGNGGIGSRFLDSIADNMRKTLNVSYKFLNKWSNKVEELVFSQYVLNRIFPSWSKSVPSVLRRALADFSLCYSKFLSYGTNNLFFNQIQQKYDDYRSFFYPHCYIASIPLFELDKNAKASADCSVEFAETCSRIIDKYYKRIDFSKAQKIADLRNLFISKLFRYVQPVDIASRAYRARRNFGLSAAREIL